MPLQEPKINKDDGIDNGVMDAGYASGRIRKPSLEFRYKVRAGIVGEAVRRYLPYQDTVRLLDLGCAEGLTLLAVRRMLGRGEYTGIEYSTELLGFAPELPDDVRLFQGDASALPANIEDDHYDAVTALALLEHLEEPALALREAYRVLRKGGLFIATSPVPFWDGLSQRLRLLDGAHHQTNLTKEKLVRIAVDSGFRVLEYSRFMFAPIGFLPYLRVRVAPEAALKADRVIAKMLFFDWLFVNQALVAVKT